MKPRSGRVLASRRGRGVAPLAQLAAALLIGAGSAALASACGSATTTAAEASDGGEESGPVQGADCPPSEPANGSICTVPEGTTCDFGQCGTRLALCTRGAWRLGANTPPSPPCPADPPSTDVKCPACWPANVSCTYGSSNCSAEDASVNTAVASCPSGTWVLDIRPCRDGGEPDVQRDAGPDAD